MANKTVDQIRAVPQFTFTNFPLYAADVTPNDNADLAQPGVVRCNGAGNVAYEPFGSPGTIITVALLAGDWVPNIVRRVRSTGTTATGLTVHY